MYIYYEKEIRELNKNRIKYLVVGGYAVNLYGVNRLTMDLDLMIDLSEEHLEKLLNVMDKLGFKTGVPKSKWSKVTAIAFKNDEEEKRIDVFLKNPIDFDVAYGRRKVFKVGKLAISCVSMDDLLEMKNKANRIRDWIDIGSLKRIYGIK
jgi:hypothetical protein